MKKSVLITGVSSGIGLAMARNLLSHGCRVFGSVRSEAKAEELTRSLGREFSPLIFDLQNASEMEEASIRLEQQLGTHNLTALINNAGSAEMGPLLHVALDDFRKQLDTLVVGHLGVIQQFHKHLLAKDRSQSPGQIFNITSISGVQGNPFFGCYAAGKHAFEGLSKSLRTELEQFRIKVTVVAPGNIRTSIWEKQTTELAERYKGTVYHNAVLGLLNHIAGPILRDAMTSEEFAEAFYEIFTLPLIADRYTVQKGHKSRMPFSKPTVHFIEG